MFKLARLFYVGILKKATMKTKLYLLAALPLTFFAVACNSSSTTTTNSDTTTTVKDAVNNAATDVKQTVDTAMADAKRAINGNPDSNFVVKVTNANRNEIAMLEAGVKMGTSKDLKAHAKMMLADHNKLAKKMDDYAKAKNYPVMPKDKATDELADMNDKKGMDWDKAWTDKMVDGHNKTIKTFEDGRNDVKDPELKSIIDNTLPTLHSHLDMVTNLKNEMK